MRLGGALLFLLGIVVTVVCAFNGCGSLFTWNGRHAIDAQPLAEGRTVTHFDSTAGRRYTLSVEVVFDRDKVTTHEGVATFEAKLPLVVRAKDPAGTILAEQAGWLDPNEPPNILYNQAVQQTRQGPMPPLIVERLVGPFLTATVQAITVEIDLGNDRVGNVPVLERRLVVHDDAVPKLIRYAAFGAAAGVIAAVTGLVMLLLGWWRRRRPRKRSRIPRPDVV